MRNLSILIPSYNDICLPLVETLKDQADMIDGLCYEIIVADDGSTDASILGKNRKIADMEHCHFLERGINVGRAAIRNFLGQKAKYDWLIFIDCEVEPSTNLITKYANAETEADIICGGITIGGEENREGLCLRYMYEKSMEPSYTTAQRNKHGFYSFRTTNFMIKKDVLIRVPFNENIKTYGYEDVIFGKQLKQAGYRIEHIDNSVCMYAYEDNQLFIEKTEEALRTLKSFSKETGDFSPILKVTSTLNRCHILWLVKLCFKMANKKLRNNLCGDNPKLLFYKLYKLGYFINQN